MRDDDLARSARGVGALAEPVRRALYRFVAGRAEPVSRDDAAAGVGVPRHTAKFHLDRLVADGLLQTRFRRPPGRGGPGAGRPTKLYLRAAQEVAVSLPERRYDLAGVLMAEAIDRSAGTGVPVRAALEDAAARHGRVIGADRRPDPVGGQPTSAPGGPGEEGPPREGVASAAGAGEPGTAASSSAGDDRDTPVPTAEALVRRTCGVLAEQGYEPHPTGRDIVLGNCPFHALVADHTELVCGMNLALLGALGETLADGRVRARLDPQPGRCCVVLTVT